MRNSDGGNFHDAGRVAIDFPDHLLGANAPDGTARTIRDVFAFVYTLEYNISMDNANGISRLCPMHAQSL